MFGVAKRLALQPSGARNSGGSDKRAREAMKAKRDILMLSTGSSPFFVSWTWSGKRNAHQWLSCRFQRDTQGGKKRKNLVRYFSLCFDKTMQQSLRSTLDVGGGGGGWVTAPGQETSFSPDGRVCVCVCLSGLWSLDIWFKLKEKSPRPVIGPVGLSVSLCTSALLDQPVFSIQPASLAAVFEQRRVQIRPRRLAGWRGRGRQSY